jgi:hypothetical protein
MRGYRYSDVKVGQQEIWFASEQRDLESLGKRDLNGLAYSICTYLALTLSLALLTGNEIESKNPYKI